MCGISVCLAPDGDFFTALRAGKADIVTDHIESFTKRGVVASGAEMRPISLSVLQD